MRLGPLLGLAATEFLAKRLLKSLPERGVGCGLATSLLCVRLTPSARNLADCKKFGMKNGGGTIRGKEWLCKGETRAPLI